MHTSKDNYLINTLRFVSIKEATQIYGALLPESLTSPKMKETKAYKTYLGFAAGATPAKIARKFKKAYPSKRDLNLNLVPMEEEPKSAKKKVSTKKTTRKQSTGVILRDTPVETSSKRKEKMDVTQGKGIDLIFRVALTEEAQYEEVRMKSLRDFHKTHPNGSGTITKTAPSATKIKPSVINEGTGVKPGVPDDEEMDCTTSQLYDDVDIQLNKPVQVDDETVQKEGTDAKLTNIQQGNENSKISQVIEDAHVTLSTVPQKTEVLVTSSSHSSDLASKFLNFSDIPHTDAKIVSPMDVHVHHEVPSKQTPTLLTVPISIITESSPIYSTVIPQSIPSFTPPPLQ
nr:hypothetical protein [Tanacetum cinerariifolium]